MAAEALRLTRDHIAALEPADSRYELPCADADGNRLRWLSVRVLPSGRKTFHIRYRDDAGKTHVVQVEDATKEDFSVSQLLARHRSWMANPDSRPTASDNTRTRVARKTAAKRRAQRLDIRALAAKYLSAISSPTFPGKRPAPNPAYLKTHAEVARYFESYILERFGRLMPEVLDYETVTPLLEDIRTKHTDRVADLAHAYISSLLTWSRRNRLVDSNPMHDIPRVGRRRSPTETRTRELRLSEFSVFWHGVMSTYQPTYRDDARRGAGARTGTPIPVIRRDLALALRLLLVLGVRRSELVEARWAEFDLDRGEWEVPASRTKTGKTFAQPLPTQAVDMLREVRRINGPGGHLFPKSGGGHMRGETLTHALRKAHERGAFGSMPQFVVHDLRRTLRTHITRTGCSREIAERLLNHRVAGQVEARYDRHDYFAEKRDALQRWADFIDSEVRRKGDVLEMRR